MKPSSVPTGFGSVTILAAVTTAIAACGSAYPPILGHVDTFSFYSQTVGDHYKIQVRLPPDYAQNASATYPVTYQLDGTDFGPEFSISAGYASKLGAAGEMPQTIVVGVGYDYPASTGYPDPGGTPLGRWRDYVYTYDDGTPAGGAKFLTFLETELLPHIDAAYRTNLAVGRGLMGHSLGGYFAASTLLSTGTMAQPPFTRFVVADPSTNQDNFRLFDLEKALSGQTQSLPRTVYYGVARFDGPAQTFPTQVMWQRLHQNYPDLSLHTELLQTDHGGAEVPSYSRGMLYAMTVAP